MSQPVASSLPEAFAVAREEGSIWRIARPSWRVRGMLPESVSKRKIRESEVRQKTMDRFSGGHGESEGAAAVRVGRSCEAAGNWRFRTAYRIAASRYATSNDLAGGGFYFLLGGNFLKALETICSTCFGMSFMPL